MSSRGPKYMLNLGAPVIDSVPVQSGATVYVPTPPVASLIIVPSMFTVPNGHIWPFIPPSENFSRRCKNEDSFDEPPKPNTRTCEHNGKSAAIPESIVLPR
jgi:hypothetical protein